MKLEGSEIYENCKLPSSEDVAIEQNRKNIAMQNIIAMLPQINKIKYVSEDDTYDTNIADLQVAISTARVEQLEIFCKSKSIAFDGGFLKVILKK